MKERGANQQERAQHYPALGIQAGWPYYSAGSSIWEDASFGANPHHLGPTSLPTNGSSVLEGHAQNIWSSSGGPSQYTSSATRPSGYDPVDSFGDGSTDFTSAVSSFGEDDQFIGDESWLPTVPFTLTGHETIGAQFDVSILPSFGSVGLDAIGGQFGAGTHHQPRTTTTANSSVHRRDRRRSSMKGDLDFMCPELGCGWTFGTKADLR
jgi:hypothetical protein